MRVEVDFDLEQAFEQSTKLGVILIMPFLLIGWAGVALFSLYIVIISRIGYLTGMINGFKED